MEPNMRAAIDMKQTGSRKKDEDNSWRCNHP
jgi:hypothetical protein